MKQSTSNDREEPAFGDAAIIKSLLNYPSLEKVFDQNDAHNLPAMRQRMQAAIDDLERVIRRGSKDDAEKAGVALKAFQTTLSFLDELEELRRTNTK